MDEKANKVSGMKWWVKLILCVFVRGSRFQQPLLCTFSVCEKNRDGISED